MEIHEVAAAVKNLSKYKVDIYDIIDMMMVWYRDVLILKVSKDPNLLVYQEEYSALNKRCLLYTSKRRTSLDSRAKAGGF